jgi:hypothetical protein
MCEKHKSTPPNTIHWSRVFCKVPLQFMQNPLIKTLYGLCKSGRGKLIYDFGIDCLWHFSCKNLSNCWSKEGKPKWEMSLCAPSRVPAPCRARAAAVSPGPHAETGQCPSVRERWDPFVPNRPFWPSPWLPHSVLSCAGRRRRLTPLARRPPHVAAHAPPYPGHAAPHAVPWS